LSTRLERYVWVTIAVVALFAAALAALPTAAEAQPEAQEEQDTIGATRQAEQSTYESTDPAAGHRVVVEPGDSLWAIAQGLLGPYATPQQVADEVERIRWLNRDRIGDDPNLLIPGQELRIAAPAAQAPATPQPAAPEPAATEPVAEPSGAEPSTPEPITAELEPVSGSSAATPAVVPEEQEPSVVEPAPNAPEEQPAEQQPVAEEPVGKEPAVAAGAQRELDDAQARRLLGFGILALTLIAAILGVSRLFMRRPVEDPGAWGTPPTSVDRNATPNGADGRPEARGPALHSPTERAPHLDDPQTRIFRQKPYVDRTGMAVLARARQWMGSRRRSPAKTKFSPNKRRPTGAHDPRVRLLLRGVPTNGARGGVRPQYRSNGGGR
jgi:hypothetical protein